MKRTNFYKMIAGTLAIAMAVTLCPSNLSAAKQNTDQKMVMESSISDAVTKVAPEEDVAKGQPTEAKAEDEPGKESAYPFDFRKFAAKSDGAAASSGLTGQCGDNVYYEIDASTGHVVIRGTGAMTDYEHASYSPFCAHSGEITSVEIQSGVTSVGANSFAFCYDLELVSLSDSVTSIGDYSFLG